MRADADAVLAIIERTNESADRPLFVLSTLALSVALIVAGWALWDQLHTLQWLSGALFALGGVAGLAAGLSLLAPRRWPLVWAPTSLLVVGLLGLGGYGLSMALGGPVGVDAFSNRAIWLMCVGLFSVQWLGITTVALVLQRRSSAARQTSAGLYPFSIRPTAQAA